ncbi:hypothetical protein [Arsenicibacter rosenii]|uniref:Potassium transporter KefB n=1 Tax=Arsenicibacter rosenii TaxID=1750698 RepID=A0A1S2VRE9_9BACT|nr:hypothetical protein [Arsenicibacter rosenii]OIN60398.1 hypothetical protein BLX24_06120 [Arsenicibacter rosenii]
MYPTNAFRQLSRQSVMIRALTGAGIALAVISLFLSGVKHPHPEWGAYWMAKPLIIVPLAGATGGAFSAFLDFFAHLNGWNKLPARLISGLVFLFGLWLGIVLGLNGTLWH